MISGLTFNHFIKDAIDIAFETLDMNIILNEEVYSNLLKSLNKLSAKKQPNLLIDLTQEDYPKIAEKLTARLGKLGIYLNEKSNEKGGANNHRRRKSDDPYNSPNLKNSPKYRNSLGVDGSPGQINPFKKTIFGGKP